MTPSRKRAAASLLANPRYELLPLAGAAERAAELPAGATVTVTCSPAKGQDRSVEFACELAARGFEVVPHLAARRMRSAAHLEQVAERLTDAGVDDVFCVGGDGSEPEGPYDTALALLEALDTQGYRFGEVGVAGHPEGHHSADDATLDAHLLAKQPYATYVTTQLCFDTERIEAWARRVRSSGITLPIHAGVPGVVDSKKLLRTSMRIGIGDSVRFLRSNRAVVLGLLRAGSYKPDGLVKQLAALDGEAEIAGLHLYTFNETGPTAEWVARAQSRTIARRSPRRRGTPHHAGPPGAATVHGPGPAPGNRRSSRLRPSLIGRGE